VQKVQTVLQRAQAGDGEAFQELVEPHRRELLVHCYRILGSLEDAEDVIQEALLAAWRGLEKFDGRSLRAWLYRIATNRCLNHLRDGARRPESHLASRPATVTEGLVSSDEPWWLEPFPDVLLDDVDQTNHNPEAVYDVRESIGLSFVAALQRLPAQQRAVLVLRDVLGFSAAESAGILGVTATSVNSTLIRARAGFRSDRRRDEIRLPTSAPEAEIVERFVNAFQSGDVQQVVALLTADAKLLMPPEPFECRGAYAIADFMQKMSFWGPGLALIPTHANGQIAFGYYRQDPQAPILRAGGLVVIDTTGDRVSTITRFADRGCLARLGLPRTLPSTPLQQSQTPPP
jgi:RNA polymerase sigma-70 factor (ECF subfamily)